MEKTSNLSEDFKARLKIIEESTPTRVRLPEIKNVIGALEALERSGDRETKELLNALNRSAGEIVKLRTVAQAGNEKLEGAFAREVSELNGAFTDVVRALMELPALIPITDTKGIEAGLEDVKRTIQDKDTAPKVSVPTPVVNIDLKDLKKDLKKVEDAIKKIELPEIDIPKPEPTDTSTLEGILRRMEKVMEAVRDRKIPIPNFNAGGIIEAVQDSAGLIPQGHDTIQITAYTANGDPETVVYRSGGASGTVVATLNLTYDSSNRISQVVRT